MIADLNMHYDNPENPHCHVMLTMRDLIKYEDGRIDFGLKNRNWNSKEFLENVREQISITTNKHLELYGFDSRVSHLSHIDRGIDLDPTVHIGTTSAKTHKTRADRLEQNKAIIKANLDSIAKCPELVLQKLSINKPVFTKDEIELLLAKSLFEARGVIIGGHIFDPKIVPITTDNLSMLTKELSVEFMIAYSKVMSSSKLSLVIE
jgi:hypothetical protein